MVKIKSTKLKDMKAGKDASLELAKYLKDHKLDPKKDWTKHPVHGKKISQWVKIIKLAEKKAEDVQMERVANGTTKKLKKPNVHTKVTTVREQSSVITVIPQLSLARMPTSIWLLPVIMETNPYNLSVILPKIWAMNICRHPAKKNTWVIWSVF